MIVNPNAALQKPLLMKNHIKYITLLTLLFLLVPRMKAQVPTSLYFMDNLPQSSMLNPAFDPSYKFYFGMPIINGVNVNVSSDIGFNDVYNDGNFFWNSAQDFTDFANNLPKTSFLSAEFNTSALNFGFAVDEGYFHFSFNQRADMRFGVPQDLFKMNDLTINHDLSGLEFQTKMYNEFAVGYSRKINDKLVVGGKLKYLAGLANAALTFTKFDITTTEEEWGFDVDGDIRTSGPFKIATDADGLPQDVDVNEFNTVSDFISAGVTNTQNPGFGIDLGVEYQIIPKLKLSASLIDLGRISWKENASTINYTAGYSFKGFTDLVVVEGGGISMNDDIVSALGDSIENSFSGATIPGVYSSTLSPKLFIAAEYEFTNSLSVGFISKTKFISDEVRQNFIFNANANLRHVLTLGLNYNMGVNSQSSYGGVIGLRLSPFYIYLASDILPSYKRNGMTLVSEGEAPVTVPIGLPASLSAANVQFGINFMIGERRRATARKNKKITPAIFNDDIGSSSLSYPL